MKISEGDVIIAAYLKPWKGTRPGVYRALVEGYVDKLRFAICTAHFYYDPPLPMPGNRKLREEVCHLYQDVNGEWVDKDYNDAPISELRLATSEERDLLKK